MPGFTWEPAEDDARFVTTGFARNAVLGVAGDVVKAVQEGHLKHIFLVGGCDGHGARGRGGSFGCWACGWEAPEGRELGVAACTRSASPPPITGRPTHRFPSCLPLPPQSPTASTSPTWHTH